MSVNSKHIKIIIIVIVLLCIASYLKTGSLKPWSIFTANVKPEDVTNKLTTNGSYPKRSLSGITDITVHHSASTTGSPEGYAKHHVNNNGWPGIGYHFVIQPDGYIYQTNELDTASYHNGFNNSQAIGIVMTGNFNIDEPTSKQLRSLRKLIRNLKIHIPSIKNVVGHGQVISTSCPGSNTDVDSIRFWTNSKNRA